MNHRSWLVIGGFTLGGAIWAYLLRKKAPVLAIMGIGWITVSLYWLDHRSEKFIGYGFAIIGVMWLLWGGIKLQKERKSMKQMDRLN